MKPAAVVLATVLLAPVSLAAQTTVDQKRPAAPDGSVSIENMAGSVKVTGWDRAEVQVKGTVGEGGELSFDGSGKRTHIEIEAETVAGSSSSTGALTVSIESAARL